MKKVNIKSPGTTLVFTIAILSAFLSHYFPETKSLAWILMAISFLYLFFGWWFFKAYHPGGNPVLLFFMGYFYSSILMCFVFAAFKWPFAESLMIAAFVWIIAQTVVLIVVRKKMPPKSFIQFIIEDFLLLLMAILQIVWYW
jgi:hypothetical protein